MTLMSETENVFLNNAFKIQFYMNIFFITVFLIYLIISEIIALLDENDYRIVQISLIFVMYFLPLILLQFLTYFIIKFSNIEFLEENKHRAKFLYNYGMLSLLVLAIIFILNYFL